MLHNFYQLCACFTCIYSIRLPSNNRFFDGISGAYYNTFMVGPCYLILKVGQVFSNFGKLGLGTPSEPHVKWDTSACDAGQVIYEPI